MSEEPDLTAAGPGNGAGRAGHRRTLFRIPFRTGMTSDDVARLHGALDLVTYMTPKPGVSGASPGVAALDPWSGLFLGPGAAEGEWILEGRTWWHPPAEAAHEWHVRGALAARELDPSVQVPARLERESDADASFAGRRAGRFSRRGRRHL